jgi:hypothetical protein
MQDVVESLETNQVRKIGSCSTITVELWGIPSALQMAQEKGY